VTSIFFTLLAMLPPFPLALLGLLGFGRWLAIRGMFVKGVKYIIPKTWRHLNASHS
jgi:hypothetical protein